MTELNKHQLTLLKKLTHPLKPVVRLGQHGLTDAVLAELEIALERHELIKIKIGTGERDDRAALLEKILNKSGATLVQQIGQTAVIFRRNRKKPKIDLPKQ